MTTLNIILSILIFISFIIVLCLHNKNMYLFTEINNSHNYLWSLLISKKIFLNEVKAEKINEVKNHNHIIDKEIERITERMKYNYYYYRSINCFFC